MLLVVFPFHWRGQSNLDCDVETCPDKGTHLELRCILYYIRYALNIALKISAGLGNFPS